MTRAILVALMLLAGCLRAPLEPHGACPAIAKPVADQMGTIPDTRSALRRTELAFSTGGTHSTSVDTVDFDVTGRYASDSVTLWGRMGASAHELVGSDRRWTLANVEVGIGYRSTSVHMGGLYRRGLAIHSELGIDVHQPAHDVATSAELVRLRPFDLLRFAPGQNFQHTLEARYEIIGCHAPFIHIQAGFRGRKDVATKTFGFPASILIGTHTTPDWTVYGEYGFLATRYPTVDDSYAVLSRLRAGVEFEIGGALRLDVHAYMMIGVRTGGAAAVLTMPLGKRPRERP